MTDASAPSLDAGGTEHSQRDVSTSLLGSALGYSGGGWPVFPIRPRGKEPLVAGGCLSASTDPDQVRAWWETHPHANIGLRTGVGFDVLDLDGPDALLAFAEGEALPAGPTVLTGRGQHIYVLATGAGNRAGMRPHIDWRGRNGYVVAPPSIHPSGRRYAWAEGLGPSTPLVEPPPWLLSLVRGREAAGAPISSGGRPQPLSVRSPRHYAAGVLRSALSRVASAPEGARNRTLYGAACDVASLAIRGWLSPEVATLRLIEAAQQAGLDDVEVRRTIRSGFATSLARFQEGEACDERP